jgi:hypothetical protein
MVPMANTHPFGLTHWNRAASTKPIGFARGAAAGSARGRDPPREIEQVGTAEILECQMQARFGLEQAGEAQPHRHHQQAESERNAQHVGNNLAEPEIRGRRGDHDDVRPRRQRHDGGEQQQGSEQDAFGHAAHHSRNGGNESGGKS